VKILFDNNVPVYLLRILVGHSATTAFREGWHELANGRLLTVAEQAGFDILVSIDQGFRHQQNMSGRSISVALLEPLNQSREEMVRVGEALFKKLPTIVSGEVVVIRAQP
jgi:hypothetical protein